MYDKIFKTASLLLMMTMGGSSALAQAWDGETKYTSIAAADISGAGTEGNPYIIDSANKFVAFGTLANNSTAYWQLDADIDLGGKEWPYSGDNAKTFKGHFDGQNHTVSNYKITPVTNKTNGLFGTVQGSNDTRAEIKDLKIDNVTILTTDNLGSTTHIGALVGNAGQYADFKNIQIVDADEDGSTVSITLDNLTGNCNIGGLIGSLQKNSTMEDITVNKPVILIKGEGTVSGGCNIGGAIGYVTGANATDVTKIDKPTSGSTNGLTVNNPSVTVHKILSSWYISTAIGRINNYSIVNYVTVANPTLIYKAVGSPNNGLYLGTLTGNIQGNGGSATATPVSTPVKNINITGTSQITIGTGSEEIKNVRAGVVGLINTNVDIANWNVATSNITVKGSLTTSTNYFGGVIGHVTSNQSAADFGTQTAVDGVTLGSSTIAVTGNVVKESYIGSIFGRIEGHNGNASNRPKRTTVTDITTTGITKVVFGSSLSPVSVANVRAGAIGFLGVNSELTHSTINDTRIELNGTLDTGSSYLGGVVAHVQSSNTAFAGVAENGIATKVDDLTVTSSTVNVTGNVTKESYVGSAFGRLDGNVGNATVAPQHVLASNITAGTMAITFGTNETPVDVAAIKAGLVGHALNYATVDTWNITTSNVTLNGTIATTAGYIGGVIGQVQSAQSLASGTNFTNISTVTLANSTVTVTGNITKDSYIGSLFGRVEGTAGNATNYPKRTTVTGVTTTGITKVVFGSNSSNVNVAGVRAGAIGSAAANAEITHSTLADTRVELNGNFVTSTGYLGGIVGQVQSSTTAFPGIEQDAIGTKIDDITVKNSTVNVTGNVAKELNVGGGFGRIEGVTSTTVAPQATVVTDIKFKNDGNTGMSSVTIGTNNTNTINYVRAGIAGMAYQNAVTRGWDIENASVVVNGKLQTSSSYVGGCIGHVQSNNNGPVTMSDMQITVSDVVAINGDIEKDTYIGGAFGRMDQNNGANNKAPTASNVNITGLNMSFGGDFKLHVYAGGIVGYLAAVNHTVTNLSSVVNCSANGQIRSSASKTFLQDKTYAFGGIVGYNNQNATTNRSEIKQCVSEVDINLGGYTPSTLAAGLSNLYKNGFAVGGVIGRLDNPSLLPEHLYYSGKIYAPFAVVGPIIGTFQKSLASSATYVYEDYSGEYAAPTLTAAEWEKEKSWYYKNYQLGLSDAVIDQTARSKNYTDTPATIDGVKYLTITDATFQEVNVINSGKLSKTVLRYTANNKNVDLGIYPNWNTNSVTYPEYYMYYMQGVNRGVYMDNVEFAKELISKQVSVKAEMQTSQSTGSYTFTTLLGGIQSDANFNKAYQWYKSDGSTAIAGETSSAITLSEATLNDYGGTVYCKITVSGTGFDPDVIYILKGSNAYVVFVNGASGQDNAGDATTRGWTPETAVKTINHANSLLRTTANGGSVDNNIIVVMGTLNSDGDFRSDGKNPATITGRYDGKDYAGIIKIKQINLDGGENVVNTINPETGTKGSNCYVQADTKFEYLTFQANSYNDGNNFIELHGNDVTFGKGLSMANFRNLTKNHGNLEAAQNIPELTIVLTATNLNEATIRRYTTRTKPQVVTFESGRYGRIMGGRYTNGFFKAGTNTSHTILGSAEHPVWAVVNVDIDKNNPNVGTITRSEAPTGTVTNNFTCDINCIIAGLTDGSMYGDYQINVHGGKVGYIVGGNQGNPVPNGSKTFTQPGGKSGDWGQWPNATYFGRTVINVEQDDDLKDIVIDNLYAGGLGREANGESATSIVDMYMYGHTEINMMSGTVNGNIYGGGAGGVIGLNPWDMHVPYATTDGENVTNAIMNGVQYGEWGAKKAGSPLASVTLHNSDGHGGYNTELLDLANSYTTLNISGGTINGSVYGGGCGYVSNMPKEVCMQGVGSVFGTSNVNVTGGTINGSVYGGSEGSDKYYGATNKYNQKITNIAEMNGTVNLTISGNSTTYPTINGSVYGAGKGITSTKTEEYLRIATTGNADLGDTYKSAVNITVDLPNDVEFPFDIYGGGEMGKVDGNVNITLKGGKLTGNVYGGGLGEAAHIEKAKVVGNTTINMQAGDPVHPLSIGKNDAARNIYGGGNLAQLVGDVTMNLNHGSIVGNVYGGGKGLSKAESGSFVGYGMVTGSSTISMNNQTADTSISGDIFGGGALGELTGNTAFTINNGTVGGYVYGGGALADVGGNTTVNLFGGSVAGAYGGGLGSNDVAAIVGGNATVQLGNNEGTTSSIVTGDGLFGGNNLNGTPKGHVFVHVLNTTTRGQANRNVAGTVANFDVAAVYGGGNQAAYEPTGEHDYAQVLIENCDNSIAYVYGGGNAAPVPATQVVIHGANAIDNAFAGGNGSGTGNLGADIGYLAYTRDDIHKYGDGTASIAVDGGTIHNVFGGSNTLGYIRTSTSVNVAQSSASGCTLNVGNTYGGGNKADLTCDIVLNMTCQEGVKTLFVGANEANVLGDATLNIYSGVYEQVFGGNNQSGVIKGKLTINVDETGCFPIMIGELYGCGNNAPYSVYGYNADNTPRTSLAGLSQGTIANERLPYGDPEINVISCTKIGRIFGGGYSTGATVYGNTHVNVNLIPGRFSGQVVNPTYKLDDNYQMVANSKEFTIPAGIGTIGNIYGGGNAAGVVGNTYVNIYTNRYNSHINNPALVNPQAGDYVLNKSPQESGVNIEGDVFGGSKGLESDPEAGKITGTTNVNIGYE